MSRLCLIDAHSLCYRAFYAIKTGLSTSYGQPTNAIYGFVNMLNKILHDTKPDYAAICFDVGKPTFREEKFKEYKIHRIPMPDDLKTQIPLIKEVISANNIKIVEKEGFEADDVIATLANKAAKKGMDVSIVTSDKDMLQLVNNRIEVYNPYKGDGKRFDSKEVEENFGVKPENIVDLLSLSGDSADNIPGVKGIGEKTAKEIIQEFGNIDKLLDNIEKIKSDKVKKLIKDNKEMLVLSRELVKLPLDVDIDIDLKDLVIKEADYDKLYAIFSKLEFKTLLKSISSKIKTDNSAKDLEFTENIKQSSDFNQLEKELKKEKYFTFSFDNSDSGLNVYIYPGNDKIYVVSNLDKLKELFKDENTVKVSSDIKSAKLIFDKSGIDIKGEYFDIMIAAYLIDPARKDYKITALLYDYLGIGPIGEEGIKPKEAIFIHKLKETLEGELNARDLKDLFYKLELPLVDVLFRMEKNGVKIDCRLLGDLSERLDGKLNKLIKEIFDLSGREFNINSPKQLGQVLFEELKLPVVKKTKTGFSTDEEVLRKLSSQHEIPSLILEYRQITKLKSTYVDVLPGACDKKDKRIHSTFLQTGTETGRLSSNNPNLQNIPIKTELGREIRSAFIAGAAKWSLLSCDYSQIELRFLAHLSKDEVLISAFQNDLDIHRMTASLLYNVQIKDVEDQMRETAKRVNFGIIYGISSYGLSKDLGIEVNLAQDFIDTYFLRYPMVKDYINSQIESARDKGYVSTIMGRRRYFPYINSKNVGLRQFSERQAVNATIQGSAADLIKLAMINIQGELDKRNMQSKMVIQVHDELVFDFLKDEEGQLIKIVRNGMESAIELDVPVKVSLKMGENWAKMKEAA
ncbi:MAG: DNA polymerase I [Candidatus Omnitrophica bacterium]|nr:DNA polymerase I [Candidatus Omnitrophota bacterium]